MRSGWVKIHRKLTENPRFTDGDWLKVWVWMLCEAAYEPRSIIWRGKQIEIEPGMFTAGRKRISKSTGVNESKVRRIIEWLKIDQQIDQQKGNKYSLFTVLKWNEHQGTDHPIDQQPTSNRPATDQQPTTSEEGEELQEGKEVKKGQPSKGRPRSVEVVREFSKEANLPDHAEHFWDHFESNGWKVGGKASMKSWQAAYRNWCRNSRDVPVKHEFEYADAW